MPAKSLAQARWFFANFPEKTARKLALGEGSRKRKTLRGLPEKKR